jgi:hypothetical protein
MPFLRADADGFERKIVDNQRDEESEQVDPIATPQKRADVGQRCPQIVPRKSHWCQGFYKDFIEPSENPPQPARDRYS